MKKGGDVMGRRRGVMSEQFKYELAKDLGFYETVQQEGWGGIKTKDAGNMVKRAIEIAEQAMTQQNQQNRL
jgi:small acid-soluble spore protein F (minor alpha/beta-type SASP)